MTLALTLVAGGAIGVTLAWLTAQTDPVVNTFTYGDIDLNLDETWLDENGEPKKDAEGNPIKTTDGNDYEMLPGEEYLKDPVVTVLEGNEACWLFVKLDEKGGVTIVDEDGEEITYDFDDYLTYVVNDGDDSDRNWTQLMNGEEAVEGVYFRYVEEGSEDEEVSYSIIGYNKDDGSFVPNKIKVKDEVTKEMLNALDDNGENVVEDKYPRLEITAYAIQYSGFEAKVNEGATEATDEQMNAAALLAWQQIEGEQGKETEVETPANP